MSTKDGPKLTGLDALEEVTKRLKGLSEAVIGQLSGDGSASHRTFTFETPKGPVEGVIGMTVRTLSDVARERGVRQPPSMHTPKRARASTAAAGSAAPARLVDIFDEGGELLVIIDAQEDVKVTAELAGEELILRNVLDGRIFEAVRLPRDVTGSYAAVQVTNGIIEVRIARPSGV